MDSPPARNVAFDDCGRALALQLIKGRKVQRSRAVCNDPGQCIPRSIMITSIDDNFITDQSIIGSAAISVLQS